MKDQDLMKLAEHAGLAIRWEDYRGGQREVDREVILGILDAMQIPARSEQQQRNSLAQLAEEGDQPPELLVGRCGRPLRLSGAFCRAAQGYGDLELEGGGHRRLAIEPQADGACLLAPLDQPGYHRLTVGGREIPLAMAPARPRPIPSAGETWGIAAQLYGLRREGDGGIGDLTGLAELAVAAARYGADAIGISPVHAQFSADVHHYSPYSPSSRLFLNALHVDLAADFGGDQLHRWLASLDAEAEWQQLERGALVDWPRSASLKLCLARTAWRQLADTLAGDNALARDFRAFKLAGGQTLTDHARFEALHADQFRSSAERWHWRDWPAPLRDPRSIEVERFAAAHAAEIDFHCFLQWQAQRGLESAQRRAREAGMAVGVLTDLAVGTDSGGSHVWSRQQDILMGLSIGAPPDMLSAKGQNWGLTTFSPRALKLHGYGPFLELLRATLSGAGGMRIDHILGLYRLWLIPDGAEPGAGAYLHYPMEDLLNLIMLEAWRHEAVVIGEDLGTVPANFRTPLAEAGILGTRVLWFEQQHGYFTDPSRWEAPVLATTTTHDLPTVAGWWQGRDLDWRSKLDLFSSDHPEACERNQRETDRRALWEAFRYAGIVDGDPPPQSEPAPVVDAALTMVGMTPSALVLVPMEDLLAEVEQPNLPGTRDEHPNWRRRLPGPASDLLEKGEVQPRLRAIAEARAGAAEYKK